MKVKNMKMNRRDNFEIESELPDDSVVDTMVAEWDLTKCVICGRRISMLDARMTKDGQHFVCKEHKWF